MKKILVSAIVAGVMWLNSADVCAVNYYVDATSGDDNNNGRSDATAWRTIGKVNRHNFQTGENVFFKCGGTWNANGLTDHSLRIDWSGTDGDPVVVGAYYMDGSEITGVNGDGKPVIKGVLVDMNDKYPGNGQGLINVISGHDWITVQDLSIKDSGNYGIAFHTDADNCVARRNDIDHTYQNSIIFYMNDDGTAEYNTSSRSNKIYLYGGVWSSAISGEGAKIIRYNTVFNGWGEGISPRSTGIVVSHNLVYNIRSVAIYIDGRSGVEIAYNLILGTDDTTYERWPGWHNSGIKICVEPTEHNSSENNKVHHNIVINTYAGIHIHNQNPDYDTYRIQNNHIYNNTLIDNKYNIFVNNYKDSIDYTNTIKNNLSYRNHVDSRNVYLVGGGTLTNWIADYNHWGPSYDSGSNALSGVNDTDTTTNMTKTAWRGTDSLNNLTFTISDLAITAGSTAIDAGVNLGSGYKDGWNQATLLPPNVVNTIDQNNYGVGWDIGAYVFTDGAAPSQAESSPVIRRRKQFRSIVN